MRRTNILKLERHQLIALDQVLAGWWTEWGDGPWQENTRLDESCYSGPSWYHVSYLRGEVETMMNDLGLPSENTPPPVKRKRS